MVVSQHSGEGKANQYYLRGFNLDHGTDFSTTVAGVPVNTPTGAHAHGLLRTLSFLIPELVSGVQFKKGPYFADEGDFSAAGAANINYVNQLDRPLRRALSGGNDGWRRLFAAASPRVGGGYLLGAIELNHNDGPWVRPDDYRKLNGVLRYSRGDNRNGFSVTGMGYWADWDATDQVAAARDRRRAHLAIRLSRRERRRQGQSPERRGRIPALARAVVDSRHGLRAAQQPQPVLELHLLPRRSGTRRPVRAGGAAHCGRRPRHLPPPRAFSATSHRERDRRAGAARLAGSRRVSITAGERSGCRRRAKTKSARRWPACTRRRKSSGRGTCPYDARRARRRLPVRRHVRQSGSTRATAPMALVSPKFAAVFGPWAGDRDLRQRRHAAFTATTRAAPSIGVDPVTGDPVDPRDPAGARQGAPRSGCARSASRACSRRSRCGTWASIRNCCSSATPARPNPAVRAVVSASSGPTTRGWRRG